MTIFVILLYGSAKNILMFLIVQTFVVTVQMYADPLLYYSDVDEYDSKYPAFGMMSIVAFSAELKNSKSGGKY